MTECLHILNKTALTKLKGVGPKIAEKLAKIGLVSVEDLLLHLPFRYEDRTQITPIAQLQAGQYTTIVAQVTQTKVNFGRKPMLMVTLRDDKEAFIILRFFNFNATMTRSFSVGALVKAFGEVKLGRFNFELIHPEYQIIQSRQSITLESALTPIYPTTEGLKQLTLRHLTDQALIYLEENPLSELLPADLYSNQMPLNDAIKLLHRPSSDISLHAFETGQHPAQKRIILEELLAQNLAMLSLRKKTKQTSAAAIPLSKKLELHFLKQLPFKLTMAQKRVVAEIKSDLQKSQPMMRLVQGDVGSGKTLVALLAALQVIESGHQVALMAPTEILAEQHANSFTQWLHSFNYEVAWLAGKLKTKERGQTLQAIETGQAAMIVGTHALFQQSVQFHNLALIIIDEQHRFGVEQRLALREKGLRHKLTTDVTDKTNKTNKQIAPHQLVMTATPIPRTLAMISYADLDISVIDELPAGRRPIQTIAIADSKRDVVINRVYAACTEEKRQAYWVCTLIDESEVLEAQAAEETLQMLKLMLPTLCIGLVHGRMKPIEKKEVMQAFKKGTIDLLVATTVIEVGVDVPNASLMIIDNPERLGLAQLHQLRGRVGRGTIASHCVLLYHAPLSKTAQQRLTVLRESNDGFIIAEKDLEIRGHGEVLGTKQTGIAEFKVANLDRDFKLIPEVKELALILHKNHPDLAKAIIQRWLWQKNIYSNA